MHSFSLVVFAVTGCSFEAPVENQGTGSGAIEIVFDNVGNAALTGVPVLIPLTANEIEYGAITDPASDLRFHDPDTDTDLAFEVDEWNPGGESMVWVRVPEIVGGSADDHIELFVGRDARGTENSVGVWQGHEAVWHLGANALASSASSTYGGIGMNVATDIGKLGDAVKFASATDSTIDFVGSEAFFDSWNQFTLEMWIRPTAGSGEPTVISTQGGSVRGGRLLQNPLRMQIDIEFANKTTYLSAELIAQQWRYVVFTFDGSTLRVYEDAVLGSDEQVVTTGTGQLVSSSSSVFLGGFNSFDGMLDEVRISQVGRDGDWIRAQHQSMNRQFVSFRSP